ncbi:HaeII family restriction endonuclease [Neisseria leonii]|uniref:HaeII family restriction endonuclease n=1 Tax=Neisseria leonii TaxID=2995413 RepID=A0A9X4E5G9_9NEIS|nr:HaeII family restriction endonuclease [Neisseria sp. 51.81]MDD9327797.1 HaeII family restriction endonuclease [Neisseria sp. 51.81]
MFTEKQQLAKQALDNVIKKSRVHLYKPIQIAEILYHDRCISRLDLFNLEAYRNPSKRWRDAVCRQFLGRVSTSTAKFQDNLFENNAIPPEKMVALGELNRNTNGQVEAYIYKCFIGRFSQMDKAIAYCRNNGADSFHLSDFLNLFWREPGLKRSIDKIYEIVVYALFDALISELGVTVSVEFSNEKYFLWQEYQEFAEKVFTLPSNGVLQLPAKIYRVGVTNAADRGLDMWSNFGLAIQVKHLSLDEELAEDIVGSISADKIIIVCKKAEQSIIVSLLTQIGWKAKIKNIVTEDDLIAWYEKALRGKYQIAQTLLDNINNEIKREFPALNDQNEFFRFVEERGYDFNTLLF